MNAAEVRDLANGLYYVAKQSKNRDLALDAVDQLKTLRDSAEQKFSSARDLLSTLESYIEESQFSLGFHAYDAERIFSDPAPIFHVLKAFLAYFVFVLVISIYVSYINNSLKSLGKN